MKILIDIGHPAHVHYFKNFIKIMNTKDHDILLVARKKEVTHDLLRHYNLDFISRGSGRKTLLGKLLYLFFANVKIFNVSLKFKPDVFLSFASPYAAQVSKILNKPHISLTDTEHANLGNFAFMFFTDIILTPKCFKKKLGKKQVYFNSYTELFYLHKKYFKPNKHVLNHLGLNVDEDFAIVRFVSWDASHDVLENGFSVEDKILLVEGLAKRMKVFVSSETEIPSKIMKYKFNISPDLFHDVLSFAKMYVGEGGTTASEAAILGVPSIYLNNLSMGYIQEEIDAGLLFQTTNLNDVFLKIDDIIKIKDKKFYKNKADKFISNKIDPTEFLVNFIERYKT